MKNDSLKACLRRGSSFYDVWRIMISASSSQERTFVNFFMTGQVHINYFLCISLLLAGRWTVRELTLGIDKCTISEKELGNGAEVAAISVL